MSLGPCGQSNREGQAVAQAACSPPAPAAAPLLGAASGPKPVGVRQVGYSEACPELGWCQRRSCCGCCGQHHPPPPCTGPQLLPGAGVGIRGCLGVSDGALEAPGCPWPRGVAGCLQGRQRDAGAAWGGDRQGSWSRLRRGPSPPPQGPPREAAVGSLVLSLGGRHSGAGPAHDRLGGVPRPPCRPVGERSRSPA